MAKNKMIKIGVMSYEEYKERTIAIAKGKYNTSKSEPKIWFSSMKTLASVLSEENQKLLRIIIDEEPQSVSELSKLTQRKANNLLRTLRTFEKYGFVELLEGRSFQRGKNPIVPKVLYNEFILDLKL